MKILMLGWELPPHNSGGLGVACYQLCQALAGKGADIEFLLPYTANHAIDFMKITPAHKQGVKEIIKAGTAYDSHKYIFEDGHEEWLDIYQQQQVYEHAVASIVHEKVFDVIHAHDWLTFRAALRVKELTNAPLVVHVHSVESDRAGGHRGNPLVHEIEETAMMLADHVVAVSQWTKDAIVRDYGIPAEKIEVVHNSIDHSTMVPLDPNNAYGYLTALKQHGYKVITNIGRLTTQKGLPNLLQAAKIVIEKEPKTFFLIVGDGEQMFELMELAAALGISKNVLFVGFQRGKQCRDAYAIADLFVMPSISEPFGLTCLEAVGYGTPALISKQSGVAEVLKNCLMTDFWDIHEMANQMVNVIRYKSLRDELHRNAYEEYKQLSWSKSAESLFSLYGRKLTGVAA